MLCRLAHGLDEMPYIGNAAVEPARQRHCVQNRQSRGIFINSRIFYGADNVDRLLFLDDDVDEPNAADQLFERMRQRPADCFFVFTRDVNGSQKGNRNRALLVDHIVAGNVHALMETSVGAIAICVCIGVDIDLFEEGDFELIADFILRPDRWVRRVRGLARNRCRIGSSRAIPVDTELPRRSDDESGSETSR